MKEPSAIEKAQVSNIIKKAKAGKVLTAREEAIVGRFEASQKPQTANPYDTDNTGIAFFFGVTNKTVCEWTKSGMPKESYGVYNLKKCFDWWAEEIDESGGDSDPSLTAARLEGQQIKNDRERMKRDTEKGKLAVKSDVLTDWVKRLSELRQGLLSLPVRLPPLLEGKSPDEMRPIIKDVLYKMMESYARTGEFMQARHRKKIEKK